MHRRINPHRRFVGIFAGDLFVDVEKISVALANRVFAETLDRVGKIEINAASARADAAAFIANFLGRARRDIARREISEARIFSLEIIIALGFRDLVRRLWRNLRFVSEPRRVRRCAAIPTSGSAWIDDRR